MIERPDIACRVTSGSLNLEHVSAHVTHQLTAHQTLLIREVKDTIRAEHAFGLLRHRNLLVQTAVRLPDSVHIIASFAVGHHVRDQVPYCSHVADIIVLPEARGLTLFTCALLK